MASHTIQTKVRGYRMEIDFDYTAGSKESHDPPSPAEDALIEITGVRLLDPGDMWEIIYEDVLIEPEDVLSAIEQHQSGHNRGE